MRHFKAVVEYDGTDLHGFQWQAGVRSVQSELEAALLRRTGRAVRVSGAGRTDAGVHALGQVVSFAADTRIPTERMALALNSALPPDVSARRVEEVGPEFHARFSASSRVYAYLILNRRAPSALLRRFSAFVPTALDVGAMHVAAQSLLGERDFAAFGNELLPGEPTARELLRCEVSRAGRDGRLVVVRVEANAFLRGMVRNLVGTLLEVGEGRRAADSLPELLESRDRKRAGPTAPAQGLCFLRARYGPRRHTAKRSPPAGDAAARAELSEEQR